MDDPLVLLVGGLVLIVAVAAVARRTGVATPLVLLVVGAVVGYIPGMPEIEVEPELILAGVLPPLLYAAAVNVPVIDFRRNLPSIGSLAVLLVIVSTLVSGLVLHLLIPDLNLAACFAVGAVISPPDVVAATSIARRMGLPERLLTVLEGESLVNDATALVLLRSAIAAASLIAAGRGDEINLWLVGGEFVFAVVVAIAIGLAVGWLTTTIRARIADPVLTTTISFTVPFLAYLPAETLHASGVLATVVAGLMTGHRGAKLFDAKQRVADTTNWRTVQFVLEHGVFLFIGLALHPLVDGLDSPDQLWTALGIGALLSVVLLVVRGGFIAVEVPLLRWRQRLILERGSVVEDLEQELEQLEEGDHRQRRKKRRREVSVAQKRADLEALRKAGFNWRGGLVVSWAGMRGVVTLAAAQSLPDDPEAFPYRSMLVVIAFTVAVVTLLFFGSTLPFVIRRAGLEEQSEDETREELKELLDKATRASLRLLDDPKRSQVHGKPADERVLTLLRERHDRPEPHHEPEGEERPISEHDELRTQFLVLRRRMREAAREELHDARTVGSYSSRAVEAAQDLFDLEDTREDRLIDEL